MLLNASMIRALFPVIYSFTVIIHRRLASCDILLTFSAQYSWWVRLSAETLMTCILPFACAAYWFQASLLSSFHRCRATIRAHFTCRAYFALIELGISRGSHFGRWYSSFDSRISIVAVCRFLWCSYSLILYLSARNSAIHSLYHSRATPLSCLIIAVSATTFLAHRVSLCCHAMPHRATTHRLILPTPICLFHRPAPPSASPHYSLK